jgi:chromosome segregation protein
LVCITRLEIQGFKSFGSRKITINLDKGFTVVTGPNGSGKSNIFDAIRFVLGDLSARSLRAEKMASVIFDGLPGRGPSTTARVAIRFDNKDRLIPMDLDAVTLSRRVNRDGVSAYFLNGRRATRAQLVDFLSVAGISSQGHNLVMQGTITRLADITPEERRKVIEDLIGIAEYDLKKSEARVQLRQADMNLRIASTRIGDVQERLERLEGERNDALRSQNLRMEVKHLQGIIASHRLRHLEDEKRGFEDRLREKLQEVDAVNQQIEGLEQERRRVEGERREFDSAVSDQGSARLTAIQNSIGEITTIVVALKVEIDTSSAGLERLTKIRGERAHQVEVLTTRVNDAKRKLSEIQGQRNDLQRVLDERRTRSTEVDTRLQETRERLTSSTSRIRDLEASLQQLEGQMIRMEAELDGESVKQRLVSTNLHTLQERRANLDVLLEELEQHLHGLRAIKAEEQTNLTNISEALSKNRARRDSLGSELVQAEEMVKEASTAIVEVETQRDLASRLTDRGEALKTIEEMGAIGAIPGIYGRVQNLITIRPKYRKAIEIASAGWLDAAVVKDFETALKCVESLKRMKIGSVKFIPLEEVEGVQRVDPPKLAGVIGLASQLIGYDARFAPAITYVLGDTIITTGEKSAFLASRAGYRAVDLNGDLYEAGGGIVSGYYRTPIDFASLIPDGKIIAGLSQSVKSLDAILVKRKDNLTVFDDEILRLSSEQVRREELVNAIDRELTIIEKNVTRSRQNCTVLGERVAALRGEIDKGNEAQLAHQSELERLRETVDVLLTQKDEQTSDADPTDVERLDKEHAGLGAEIATCERDLFKFESDIALLHNTLATFTPELDAVMVDAATLDKQIHTLHTRISEAQAALDEETTKLPELEKAKEALSRTLSSVTAQRTEFVVALDGMDAQLQELTRAFDPLNRAVRQLELEVNTKEIAIVNLQREIVGLEFEVGQVSRKAAQNAEASLQLIKREMDRLSSVNQLAVEQYREQQSRYKRLSVKRHQLAAERRSILDFIDEIEQTKRSAFTQSLHSINENFQTFFEKLTGGGRGRLSLQNPDRPFEGGVDLYLQFPGKASRMIAGASGGEKSVAAVSFIFAIQRESPAPFYIFDEIDAHLDPHNAERLADLTKEQSRDSQFVVITLRDVLMDRADRILGVYVQNSLSRIASFKVAEAAS